jgi:hypothetical protein
VGRKTSASSVYSPFSGEDARKRHTTLAGEPAHRPSTSSIDRANHASLVHSMLTGQPRHALIAVGRNPQRSCVGHAESVVPELCGAARMTVMEEFPPRS